MPYEHTSQHSAGSTGEPAVLSQGDADIEVFVSQWQRNQNQDTAKRLRYGFGLLGFSAVTAAGILLAHDEDARVTVELPFVPEAQTAVESIDDILSTAGGPLLLGAATTVAAVKIGGRRNASLHAIDVASSQELTDDGRNEVGPHRRFLRNVAAGSIPAVASVSVGVGGLMAAVGTELSTGPSRPIETFLGSLAEDNDELSLVVQDKAATPMTESNISRELAASIQQTAAERGVAAAPVDMYLGTMYEGDQNLTTLVFGIPQEASSPLHYDAVGAGCENVPVAVDSAAYLSTGTKVNISGIDAVVVEQNSDTSAINRIGIEADPSVVAACFNQDPEEPHDMVVLATDLGTAQDIVSAANADIDNPAAVISDAQYTKNSEEFWTANAKPLTNITASMAAFSSFVAMGGVISGRLMRNRREWATKLAQGVPDNQLRATELLRSLKDGMVASVTGVSGATALAPAINFLESGLRVGMDLRSAMAASAIGIIGSVAGTVPKIIRPRKVVNPAEHTRI